MRAAIARPHGKGRLQLNARLVREKDRARLRELRRLALYGAVIVVPLLIYVWQRVDFIRTSYSLEALNRERQQLQEQNKQYTLERSSLLAPDRIEKVARKQLGLSEPTPEDVRRVQVIDGRVNEVGATLAAGLPRDADAPRDADRPEEAGRTGDAAPPRDAPPRRAARAKRGPAGSAAYTPASILPALPRPEENQEAPR